MSSLVVSRINRALNPAATGGGAAGWTALRSFGSGADGTYTYVTSPTGPWGGSFTVRRKQWTVAQSANNGNVGYQVNADGSNYFPVTAGEVLTVSAYMRRIGGSSTTKTFVMRVNFYNQVAISGAASVGSTLTGTGITADTVNTWYRPYMTFSVPTGAVGMQVYPDTASVGDPVFGVGDGLDATALLIEASPTLNDYFDGTTTDTAARLYDWNDTANSSISRQTNVIDWQPNTPVKKNLLSYWDAGAWQPILPSGITGPQGPTGPEGIRTSCGGCRIKGSQGGQPSGAIWDVDNYIVESTWSTDPNPCIGISASNELQILRNTSSLIITATLTIGGGIRINSRSYMAITFQPSGYIIGRCSITQTEDSVSLTVLSQFNLGDKIRVQTYLNTTSTPIPYSCYVTAALSP